MVTEELFANSGQTPTLPIPAMVVKVVVSTLQPYQSQNFASRIVLTLPLVFGNYKHESYSLCHQLLVIRHCLSKASLITEPFSFFSNMAVDRKFCKWYD